MRKLIQSIRWRIGLVQRLCRIIGLRSALTFTVADDWHRHVRPESHSSIQVLPKGYSAPVLIRLGSSDSQAFEQVFVSQQYGGPAAQISEPRVIVDCGANVGYSSVYFLQNYPAARVIALEPDPLNAEICRRNLLPYGKRAVVLQKALWGTVTPLALVEGTRKRGEEWGVQVSADPTYQSGTPVDAIDLPTLLSTMGVEQIDLLKVDIEKSEAHVFATQPDVWLGHVRSIAIELHDEKCRDVFYSALDPFVFDHFQNGEITLCLNIRRKLEAGGISRPQGGSSVSA